MRSWTRKGAEGRELRNYHWLQWNRNSQWSNACCQIPRTCLITSESLLSLLPCSLIFDKSFIWVEETIYCRLLEILSFLELLLLIIRPFVASGMFVSPILVKGISFFSFYRSLWTKATWSLSLSPRRHGNSAKYCCVVWPWRNCVSKQGCYVSWQIVTVTCQLFINGN